MYYIYGWTARSQRCRCSSARGSTSPLGHIHAAETSRTCWQLCSRCKGGQRSAQMRSAQHSRTTAAEAGSLACAAIDGPAPPEPAHSHAMSADHRNGCFCMWQLMHLTGRRCTSPGNAFPTSSNLFVRTPSVSPGSALSTAVWPDCSPCALSASRMSSRLGAIVRHDIQVYVASCTSTCVLNPSVPCHRGHTVLVTS